MSKPAGNPCKVEGCGTTDENKPQIFRGEDWCSDSHRKMLNGELPMQSKQADTFTTAPPIAPREARTEKY